MPHKGSMNSLLSKAVFAAIVVLVSTVAHGNQPTAASNEEYSRMWTDQTGRKMEAVFIGYADGRVQVRRVSDGETFFVPIERLSDADQSFIRSRAYVIASSPATRVAPTAIVGDWWGTTEEDTVFVTFTQSGRCLTMFRRRYDGIYGNDIPYTCDASTRTAILGAGTQIDGGAQLVSDDALDFRYKAGNREFRITLRRTATSLQPWQKDWGEFARTAAGANTVLVCWGPTIEWTGIVSEIRPPKRGESRAASSPVDNVLSFLAHDVWQSQMLSEGSIIVDMGLQSVTTTSGKVTILAGVEIMCLKDQWPVWSSARTGERISFRGRLAPREPPILHGIGAHANRAVWGNIVVIGTELLAPSDANR